jgi:hypothetical protein
VSEAVAEREAEQQEKVEPVTFISKCPNLVVVVEPRFDRFNHMGIKIGQDRGRRLEFDRHRFTTDDPEIIKLLRAKPHYNVPNNQGFYEEGKAPDEPKPTLSSQLEAIEAAAETGDVDALGEVISEEKATLNREAVFAPARAVLKAIAGRQEAAPSTEEH